MARDAAREVTLTIRFVTCISNTFHGILDLAPKGAQRREPPGLWSLSSVDKEGDEDREEIDNCGEVVNNRGRVVDVGHGAFSFLKICREASPS